MEIEDWEVVSKGYCFLQQFVFEAVTYLRWLKSVEGYGNYKSYRANIHYYILICQDRNIQGNLLHFLLIKFLRIRLRKAHICILYSS